ncbi:MAG: hypothetical protein WAM44_09025 [Chthoniobacterales bacterium]
MAASTETRFIAIYSRREPNIQAKLRKAIAMRDFRVCDNTDPDSAG